MQDLDASGTHECLQGKELVLMIDVGVKAQLVVFQKAAVEQLKTYRRLIV